MQATSTKSDLARQADELSKLECAVETNEGTFGASECCRAVGTGDPTFGNYTIYERVGDGDRRVVGCNPDQAPGYPRIFRDSINERRADLAKIRQQLRAVR